MNKMRIEGVKGKMDILKDINSSVRSIERDIQENIKRREH